jgi:hypothetical protein
METIPIKEIAMFFGVMLSIISAFIAFGQAKIAKQSLKQASLIKLFSAFDLASQITISKPDLLYSVHGLDKSKIPPEEAINIAYLSALLDSFQHYFSIEYNSDFRRMGAELKYKSSFLNRILEVKDNQRRWPILKELYYGEFDSEFTQSIDSLIEYIRTKNRT